MKTNQRKPIMRIIALALSLIMTFGLMSSSVLADQQPYMNGATDFAVLENEVDAILEDEVEDQVVPYTDLHMMIDNFEEHWPQVLPEAFEAAMVFGQPIMPMSGGSFSGGSGTASDPFIIMTADELAELADYVNTGNTNFNASHYRLGNNISLAAHSSGTGWIPIGNTTNSFMGVFDGNGLKITDLYINTTTLFDIGLFGSIHNATIKNLGVTEISITSIGHGVGMSGGRVGGIAGRAIGNSHISNSYTTGSISGNHSVGGIVGDMFDTSTISNSFSTASVTGTGIGAGGIAGVLRDGNIVRNAYATGVISAFSHVGGIVGFLEQSSQVENSVALNSSVGYTTAVDAFFGINGRVFGHMPDTATSAARNHALSTMGNGGRPFRTPAATYNVHNMHNGADITAAQSISRSFWTTSTPQFTAFDESIWVITDGNLPTLSVFTNEIRSITLENNGMQITGVANANDEIVFEMTQIQYQHFLDNLGMIRGTIVSVDADYDYLAFRLPSWGTWNLRPGAAVGFYTGDFVSIVGSNREFALVVKIMSTLQNEIRSITIESGAVQITGVANASDEIVFRLTAPEFDELSDDMGWLRAEIVAIDAGLAPTPITKLLRFRNTYGYWDMGVGRIPGFYNGHTVSIPGYNRLFTFVIIIGNAPDANRNLSHHYATMTASSQFHPANPPHHANDNNPLANVWRPLTPGPGPEYLTAEFVDVINFNQIRIYQNGNRIRNYRLKYSIDDVTWNILHTEHAAPPSPTSTYSFGNTITARYVRLVIGHSFNNNPAAVFQFDIRYMP